MGVPYVTVPGGGPSLDPRSPPERSWVLRLFNSPSFLRLWLAQVVSSLGDWVGFVAVTSLAARVGGGRPETAAAGGLGLCTLHRSSAAPTPAAP